jgi:hypothetical protein
MSKEINWNEIRFRASSWGNLLTEPVTKAAKEAGELSVTCQKELIKIYNQEVYGRKKDITTKQMDKGIACEDEAIKMFGRVDGGVRYYKNGFELENEWFKGHPDVFNVDATHIFDIKCSWDLDTFMPKLIEEPDKGYIAQLNVYYDITETQGGGIVYCLVSAPDHIINQELENLQYRMAKNTDKIDFSADYGKAARELRHLMFFNDIPESERVIKIPIPRNEELIQKMKDKVPVLREWLKNFHEKHMNLYPKMQNDAV